MESNGEKSSVSGQSFLRWSGRIVSLTTAVLKFIAALPALIPLLEKNQSNAIVAHVLAAVSFLHDFPWGNAIIIICCGFFLATIGMWIRWVEKGRNWWKNLKNQSKTNDLKAQLDLLHGAEQIEIAKRRLRVMGIFLPGDEVDDESKLTEYFLKSEWAMADQLATRKKYPLYRYLMVTAPRFLKINAVELHRRLLACGVTIPLPFVNLLLGNPHFVLKRRYWPALCHALYAHEGFIEGGRRFDYHKKWHMCRIQRYHSLHRVEIFLFAPNLNNDMSNLPSISGSQCRTIVQFAEQELAELEKLTDDERSEI